MKEVFSFICFLFGKYYYLHAYFLTFIRHVGFQNKLYEEGLFGFSFLFVSFLFGLVGLGSCQD